MECKKTAFNFFNLLLLSLWRGVDLAHDVDPNLMKSGFSFLY